VPFANIVNPDFGWQTILVGFNRLFGLSRSDNTTGEADQRIQQYIEDSTKNTYLDPMGVYDRYYTSMVLQTMCDGFLRATGARVIHLSVELDSAPKQLEIARLELDASLQAPYVIPNPDQWYNIAVDHTSCEILHDTRYPQALGDTHPGQQHHHQFAQHLHTQYF
jgi:hypothetical protein